MGLKALFGCRDPVNEPAPAPGQSGARPRESTHARWAIGVGFLVLFLALAPAASRPEDPQERAIRALRQDPSLKVRTQAALVLGQRGGAGAVAALREALDRDESAAVRMAAAGALGRIGDSAARDALERASTGDVDSRVRAAAARALADLGASRREGPRARTLTIEDVQGARVDAATRQALRAALGRHLAERGFSVVGPGEGAAYRIKPAILSLDVAEAGGKTVIIVRASTVAVDGSGRMAAMIEGSARLRAEGHGLSRSAQARLSAKAIDAAASSLSEDLAAKLQ